MEKEANKNNTTDISTRENRVNSEKGEKSEKSVNRKKKQAKVDISPGALSWMNNAGRAN